MGLMNKWMYGHPNPETLPLKDARRATYTKDKLHENKNIKLPVDTPFKFMGYTVWKNLLSPVESGFFRAKTTN